MLPGTMVVIPKPFNGSFSASLHKNIKKTTVNDAQAENDLGANMEIMVRGTTML